MKHIIMVPSDPHPCGRNNNVPTQCWLCDGGLACCKVCGLVESQLDDQPECPGEGNHER